MDSSAETILIDAVRDRRSLWDKTHYGFRNKLIKEREWRKVSEMVNKSALESQNSWKKLRAQYMGFRRRLRKQSGSDGVRPTFRHEIAMNFLSGVDDGEEQHSNIKENVSEDETDIDMDDMNVVFAETEIKEVKCNSEAEGQEIKDALQTESEMYSKFTDKSNIGTHEKLIGSKKKGKYDIIEEKLVQLIDEMNDEFVSYGRTISVKLRHISEKNRKVFLQTQFNMNSILHEAEMELLNN